LAGAVEGEVGRLMFYRLGGKDAAFLLVVFGLSAVGFVLPQLRARAWHGVSWFGWWMAALMVAGPLVGYLHMRTGARR